MQKNSGEDEEFEDEAGGGGGEKEEEEEEEEEDEEEEEEEEEETVLVVGDKCETEDRNGFTYLQYHARGSLLVLGKFVCFSEEFRY